MLYTIKQAAEKTGLTEHTIRYYDREGLLPLLERTEGRVRRFSEENIHWLELICCLKNSGMSINEIKTFMNACLQGEKTSRERKEILITHQKHILEQIKVLENSLQVINYKIEHYKEIGVFHMDSLQEVEDKASKYKA